MTDLPHALVVTGAGASAFCLKRKYEYGALTTHFPPLTKDLVARLQPYGGRCRRLLSRIDLALSEEPHIGFEPALKRIMALNTKPEIDTELLELLDAIQKLMRLADDIGQQTPTLYTDLVAWLTGTTRRTTFVTLNYDRLLDFAIADHGLSGWDRYADPARSTSLYHLHGCSNWRMHRPEPGRPLKGEWKRNGGDDSLYLETSKSDNRAGSWRGAIALPIDGKDRSNIVCPKELLDQLEQDLPAVTDIIVIGWRGADTHVVELLAEHMMLGEVRSIHLVAASTDGTDEMTKNLAPLMKGSRAMVRPFSHPDGFLGYLTQKKSPLRIDYPRELLF
jgi:hypothetical protein